MKSSFFRKVISSYAFLALLFAVCTTSVCAQDQEEDSTLSVGAEFKIDVRVSDINTLIADNNVVINLWGIEKVSDNSPIFLLKARSELEKKIGDMAITCTVKAIDTDQLSAQCVNDFEEDLSMFLLQQGYVSVNRKEVFNTVYEIPYITAERQADSNGKGIWASADSEERTAAHKESENFMFGAIALTGAFLVGIAFISVYIMRGFGRVADLQTKSLDMAERERTLKDKEKFVIASLLHSEIRENKSKIDAYLMVYEETLKELNDPSGTPQCLKTGEMIQKQPSLSRSVFDGNTNRLDLLGANFSSDIIHYYARIKSEPDYIKITPETKVEEARKIVNRVVDGAKKLNDISDHLLERFAKSKTLREVESVTF